MCKVNNIIFGWQRVDIAFQMNLVFYEKWFHSYIYTWHEGYNHKGICKINWLDSYVIQPKTLFINECCDIIVISEWVLTWMLIIEKCKLVCHGQKSKRNILRIVLFKDQQLLFLLRSQCQTTTFCFPIICDTCTFCFQIHWITCGNMYTIAGKSVHCGLTLEITN